MATLSYIDNLSQEELNLLVILSDPVAWSKLELGWEARWYQAEILRSRSRKIVVRAGRRTGKTDVLAVMALYHAYLQPNRGKTPAYRVMYVTPYEAQVKEFFSRIRELISHSPNLSASVIRDVKNPHEEMEFANGSLIRGMSAGSKTGKGAANIRGQRADLLIMDEAAYLTAADVNTLLALQLEDPGRIRIIAASTPAGGDNHFRRWCLNPELGWQEFHYPSWANPHWNAEMEAELREELPGDAFTLEVAAEFATESSSVFPRPFLDRAVEQGRLINLAYAAETSVPTKCGPRVMGVDWDKYGAGTNLVIVEFDRERGLYKPIWRTEIPKSKFTLDNAVRRIIEVNELFEVDYIYVDRGYGEHQVETLHRHGLEHPRTGLHEKVIGVTYSDSIKILDPFTRVPTKKRLKHWVINQLQVLLERGHIAFPPDDRALFRQFVNYRVTGYTSAGEPIYSDNDEHIIDAIGLAIHGLLQHFSDICKIEVGRKVMVVSNPMIKADRTSSPGRTVGSRRPPAAAIGRRRFGSGGLSRARF